MTNKENTLPEGWEIKKLGEVCEVQRGSSPRPIKKFLTDNINGVNWIKIGDTKLVKKYIHTTNQKITKEGAKKSRYVEVGDFIISNSMSFGKPYIMKTNGCIHDGWFKLKLSNNIDKDFFYNLLSSDYIYNQFLNLAVGAVVKNISGDLIKKTLLPIPPLSEQKRIVKILDEVFENVEEAKKNAEENLRNAKELFESYLQNVFEEKGEDWEEKKLGEVCEKMFAGGDVPKDNLSKFKTDKYNIPIYANGIKNKGLYGYTDIEKVTEKALTISARGTIGYIEERHNIFYPIVRLIVLIPDKGKIKLSFLKYFLKTFDILKSGTSIPQLTIPMIKKYIVNFPKSLEKQKEIVGVLDELSGQVEKLEGVYGEKVEALEELKRSVLEEAFGGRL